MMDCIIYFVVPPKKDRYPIEISLDDSLQKGLSKLSSYEDISLNGVHDISTKKGRSLNLTETFRNQGIRAGSELIVRKREVKISNKVKIYGVIGGVVILILLVVIIMMVTDNSSVEERSLSDKNLTMNPIETKDDSAIRPSEREDFAQLDLQNLQGEINRLTYPSLSYSMRKQRKEIIIYNYFSGPNATVLEKFRDVSTNTTTIDQWLKEFIVQDNNQVKIPREGLKHQNGKINFIVIQND